MRRERVAVWERLVKVDGRRGFTCAELCLARARSRRGRARGGRTGEYGLEDWCGGDELSRRGRDGLEVEDGAFAGLSQDENKSSSSAPGAFASRPGAARASASPGLPVERDTRGELGPVVLDATLYLLFIQVRDGACHGTCNRKLTVPSTRIIAQVFGLNQPPRRHSQSSKSRKCIVYGVY
ncbi:hypothetical protein EXIGLDRAFT_460555 [Exidia glandulosa HHB12029]|uniref:Uncharacterized protein n=1 Tax=Exidia glandulosa HHB12029 TaxID=1314781 RepID=A0A165K5Q3_EXIGL|nr:hypothetical protein EXIGLDRAFT_460555 [Exidia glandulosa HHB12029]